MSLFGKGSTADRYGVIVEIGSGSVLAAIVHSKAAETHPQIIWSHREQATLRNTKSLKQSAKAVVTALVNSVLKLDAEGRKVLHQYNKKAKITEFQCTISAPWSYTVTKIINYKPEEEFKVTEELITELTNTVQTQIEADIQEDETLLDLGLQVTARVTMGMITNGYAVVNPVGNMAKSFTISRASAIAQEYLIEGIDEMQDKLFVGAQSKKLSFMLVMFAAAQDLFVRKHDLCLVDVTHEAVEIGIVRDCSLTYCTHTPSGTFSLVRDIAKITKVPLTEAFGYLHKKDPYAFLKKLNPKQQAEVEVVFEGFTEKIAALFLETGDSLSTPKQILLHTDLNTETLFTSLIEKAAKRALRTNPYVLPLSKEIIAQTYVQSTVGTNNTIPVDTALLLSAWFFHTTNQHKPHEYL